MELRRDVERKLDREVEHMVQADIDGSGRYSLILMVIFLLPSFL